MSCNEKHRELNRDEARVAYSYQKCPFAVFIVMYRNLYPKSSFRSCPYTVLVKCPGQFYSIFDEIGQNVGDKMYFYHKSHCSTTPTEIEQQRFQFTCAREWICAEKLRRTFIRSED